MSVLTSRHHGQVAPEGDARTCACAWAYFVFEHTAKPEAVHSSAWCRSWVIEKDKNPAAWKAQRAAILAWAVMCHNVRGVSDQKMSAAHNFRARP